MEKERTNSPQAMTKTIVLTFLKSAILCVSMAFCVVAVMVGIAPLSAARFFETFRANDAAVTCYELAWADSTRCADIYNLIGREIGVGAHKKVVRYIDRLQESEDYREFVKKADAAAIEASEPKYIAYVGDLDGYLCSQKTLALMRLGKREDARTFALRDLANPNVHSFALSTYVAELVDDKAVSDEDLVEALSSLLDETIAGQSVSALIEARLEMNLATGATSKSDKIVKVYTSMKIYNTLSIIYECKGEAALAADADAKISELQAEYHSLVAE